jgi:hypothetical protein
MQGISLKNSQSRSLSEIQTLLDSLSSAATITNSDNIFTYANAAFLKKYDYKLSDIIGVSPQILQPKKSCKESYRESCKIAIAQNKPWSGRIYNIDSKQNEFEVYLCIVPLKPIPTLRAAGFLGMSTPAGLEAQLINDIVTLLFAAAAFMQSESPIHQLSEGRGRRTTRQSEILKLFNLGYLPKEIASLLNITTSTVNVVRWKSRQPIKAK